MAEEVQEALGPYAVPEFLTIWGEERDRQFREEVPKLREVDLEQRFGRVLARLRGEPTPGADEPWDDAAAATRSSATERQTGVDAYSRAFVETIRPAPEVEPFLRRLAKHRRLAILSNWPLAVTLDRFALVAGWAPHLAAIIVSQRVGTIKPDRRIFEAARAALGDPPPAAILHVGDDWAADVVGARRAGWRAAYLADRAADSPFPTSDPDEAVSADLVLDRLADLEGRLVPVARRPDLTAAGE